MSRPPRCGFLARNTIATSRLAVPGYIYGLKHWRRWFAAPALLCAFVSCSSSRPSYTAEDYKAATLVTAKAEAYQDTYAGDDEWIITADSEVTFADGSNVHNNIQLHYDGRVAEQGGYCIFALDDDRDLMQDKLDVPKLVRHCDGKTTEDFVLGDITVSIIGHPATEDGLPIFHIDSIWAPKVLMYYSGHSPSTNDESDDRE
jgi:hypothetical protein